jgi:hypothetical protein
MTELRHLVDASRRVLPVLPQRNPAYPEQISEADRPHVAIALLSSKMQAGIDGNSR